MSTSPLASSSQPNQLRELPMRLKHPLPTHKPPTKHLPLNTKLSIKHSTFNKQTNKAHGNQQKTQNIQQRRAR